MLLDAGAASCRARAWIGRMGEQPLATLFAVDLDEEVADRAEGETPLLGLAPGTYDVHFEGDGCWWHYSLIGRRSSPTGELFGALALRSRRAVGAAGVLGECRRRLRCIPVREERWARIRRAT